MANDAFKTRKGQDPLEIGGVGIIDDKDGVPLERAAQRMPELQDENGTPLTGASLLAAGKKWADSVGVQVGKSKTSAEEELLAAAEPTDGTPDPAAETKE